MKKRKIKNLKSALIILVLTFLWNQCVYSGARWIAQGWHHYDMTTQLDKVIPFLPWTIIIYLGCYIFWCMNYFMCAVQPEAERNHFFCAEIMAKGCCFLLFLLIPTTNIRPDIPGDTICDNLMRSLYQLDAADNLFPSIHCLVSWFCWIGVRNRRNIPGFYRWFSLIAAIAVCISTLTTRQHVIADVIGGILLAEGSYYIMGRFFHDRT